MEGKKISKAVLKRLPGYLAYLKSIPDNAPPNISATALANALGMGALYNGFLARIADANEDLKKWLGIEGKTIKACLLLGYPDRKYARTAPRKEGNVILK